MFDPMSVINLKQEEIVKKISKGSKYFIRTKYARNEAYTGGYHKYFKNLSQGRYKKNPFDDYEGWGGPRTWKFIFKHISVADKLLSHERPIKVLDIGCSSGFLRKILESNTFKKEDIYYYGIDVGEHRLMSAMSDVNDIEAAAIGDNIPSVYINHDVRYGLPFGENVFDFVVSFEMTKYLKKESVKKLFGEISRVLKPGGTFIYSVAGICDNEDMMTRLLRFKDKMKSMWYIDELKEALNKQGLEIMKVYGSEAHFDIIKKLLRDNDKKTFIKANALYPKELMEAVFGPFYPEATSTKLLFISKGNIKLIKEVRLLFSNETFKELSRVESSRVFTTKDKVIKYVAKPIFEKNMKIYRMLVEQTEIKLPIILDIKESKISENYIIIMKNLGEAVNFIWNGSDNDKKEHIITNIVDILKQIHSININPRNSQSYMRLSPKTFNWKDEIQNFIKSKLDYALLNKKINKNICDRFNSIFIENKNYIEDINYVLIHNDINLNNLFIDKKNQLCLAFDFETSAIGDKHLDFVITKSFMPEKKYQDMMIDLYEVPKNFDKISQIYRLTLILMFLGGRYIKTEYGDDIIKFIKEGRSFNMKWFSKFVRKSWS